MSLERAFGERVSRCEGCGRRILSPVIIEGHPFCNSICFSRWKWKKERSPPDER